MQKPSDKEIVLVMGGARSGKSAWALKYTQDHYESCLFIATAEVKDEEMEERVRLHQSSRGPMWNLLEEPLHLDEALCNKCDQADAVLIDCLTIWLSNVLLTEGKSSVADYQQRLVKAIAHTPKTVVMVSNEVGTGIVPEHRLGRDFRDLAGMLNQNLAAMANKVVLTVAGLPLHLK
jgi:adenosylcobinamide kinase/adenosylcobinamide-phosphate guanylyltransferase